MELKVFKDTVSAWEGRWETRLELPLETEILVPDYLPAVFKIVKCIIEPVLLQNSVSGTHWQADGYLRCTVYYQSDEAGSCLCRAEQKFTFEKAAELPEGRYTEGPATVAGELEYCNCRAVSEHRIDLRGAYFLNVSVSRVADREIVTSLADCGVELRTQCISGCVCAAADERSFTAQTEIDLPGAGETILDIGGYAAQDSLAVGMGSYRWQGRLCVQVIYRPAGSETITSLQKEIAVHQEADLPGIGEGDAGFAWGAVLGCTLTAPEDGDKPVLGITWKLHTEFWRGVEQLAVADAYSTLCAAEVSEAGLALLQPGQPVGETVRVTVEDDLPEKEQEVKGCFATLGALSAVQQEEGTVFAGKGTAHVICADDRGELTCYDKPFDWALPGRWEESPKALLAHLNETLLGVSGSKEGGRMKVQLEIGVTGAVLEQKKFSVVEGIALGEEFPEKSSGPALYLYYAGEGETLFQIAKRYHARVKDLAAANQLEEDTGESLPDRQVRAGCLLIPAAL